MVKDFSVLSTTNSKSGFLELAPKSILRYGTKTGRFVVRFFFGFAASQDQTFFCGQEYFSGWNLLCCFVARNISGRDVLWPDFFLCTGRSVSGPTCTQALASLWNYAAQPHI